MSDKQTPLDQARNLAMYFTMSTAVASAIFWAATAHISNPSTTITSISTILIYAVMVGGVAMGLLYLAFRLKKK